jgi:cell division protein FtsQ
MVSAPELALIHPEQVVVSGSNGESLHYVSRATVLEIFAADRGKSILRIPIDQRRHQLESIAWIEHATVRRALPNTIEVEINERTPVAFLRQGSDLSLIDAHGVILERPLTGDFHFPVVTGIASDMAADQRERRMQLFSSFSQQVEQSRSRAIQQVSEVDLSDSSDVVARVTGLQPADSADQSWGAEQPVMVHFGDGDFEARFRTLLDNIGQWRATAGRVESVDLRFSREAIVNPDTSGASPEIAQRQPPLAATPASVTRRSGVKHSR